MIFIPIDACASVEERSDLTFQFFAGGKYQLKFQISKEKREASFDSIGSFITRWNSDE